MLRPWQVLASRRLLTIDPWLTVDCEQIRLPDGQVVDDFYAVGMPDFVVVVAAVQDGRIIGERHYKHGPRGITLGLPAGYLRTGEDPLEGAARELLEETGYHSTDWRALGRFAADGNRGCGFGHLYLARDCMSITTPRSGDLEEIRIELLALDDMITEMSAGTPQELCTAAALGLAYREMHQHE